MVLFFVCTPWEVPITHTLGIQSVWHYHVSWPDNVKNCLCSNAFAQFHTLCRTMEALDFAPPILLTLPDFHVFGPPHSLPFVSGC